MVGEGSTGSTRCSERSRLERQKTLKTRPIDHYGRVSVRSKGSSNSSEDKIKIIKDCCRNLIEFMFTQVGVGGLVVCYTIFGAIAFQHIETQERNDYLNEVHEVRDKTVESLWNVTTHFNILNNRDWEREIQRVLLNHQASMVHYIKSGYDEQTVEERWTFPAALMFTLSVITMIGYGNMVPRTDWGKIATMLYALFGIPVYVLYFMNMGKVFATLFKWCYRRLYNCLVRKNQMVQYDAMENEGEVEEMDMDLEEQQVMIPSTACIWVMLGYLLTGTIMFAEWEQWNYLDSTYFCVTSLCKIGLGDFVPGTSIRTKDGQSNNIKLIINFVYLLVGMGVVAMNYYLLKEEVILRLQQFKRKLKQKCSEFKSSVFSE